MDTLREKLGEQLSHVEDSPLLYAVTLTGIFIAISLIVWLASYQTTRKPPLRERMVLALLGLAFGLLLFNYFFPGDFVGGDGALHISRIWLMMDVLDSGELPIWSNRYYFGHPQELFFGYVTYLSTIGVSKFTGLDLFASTKLLLWAVHVASGLLMYVYARRRFANTALAILAATAYVISWQHFGVVRRFGILPLAVIYLLIPALLLVLEYSLIKRASLLVATIVGGVLCAVAVLTHIQYGTYLSITYVAILAWVGFVSLIYRDLPSLRTTILLVAGTGVVAFLLAGWLVLPSVLERGYLPSIPQLFDTLSLGGLLTAAMNIVLITNVFESWGQGYVGLSILVPAFVGILVAAHHLISRRNVNQETLIEGYPFVVAVIGFVLLDPIKRYTGIWLFFTCIAAAYGVAWIAQRLTRSAPRMIHLYQAALVLVVLELAPALLLVGPYRGFTPVHEDVARFQNEILASNVPGRIMVFEPDRGIFWRAEDTMYTNASIPFGGSIQESTQTFNIMAAISNQLATEVYDGGGEPSDLLLDLLRLMNVRYVVMNDREFFAVTNATPVLFAPTIRVTEAQDSNGVMGTLARELYEKRLIQTDYVDTVADQMQLDVKEPHARAMLVKRPLENMAANAGACLAGQPFTFNGAVERHNTLAFNYSACEAGYIRLAYAYYPLLRLEVDGVERPFYADAFNMIVFPASAGEHRVTLTAVVSPLREGLFKVAAVCALAIVVWAGVQLLLWYRRRRGIGLQPNLEHRH